MANKIPEYMVDTQKNKEYLYKDPKFEVLLDIKKILLDIEEKLTEIKTKIK
jgi:hypothetical protein